MHGYRHRAFPLESAAMLRGSLAYTQFLIVQACQREPTTINMVRPPYGLFLPSTLQMLGKWGYQPVMWSVAPFHWLQSAQATIRQAQREVTNGSLLVLHEGLAGPSVLTFTEPLIMNLKAAGFQFVTVNQMEQPRHFSGDLSTDSGLPLDRT
jgi:peptidoglycan/xylan/chitin deacetylase (PgdA/CDA1 family)